MKVRHYYVIERKPTSKASFQDSFIERYSESILDSYEKGDTDHVYFHFNSCTLLSKCYNTKSLGTIGVNEVLTIASDSLKQVELTKELLKDRFPNYELIPTKE